MSELTFLELLQVFAVTSGALFILAIPVAIIGQWQEERKIKQLKESLGDTIDIDAMRRQYGANFEQKLLIHLIKELKEK